MKRITRAEWKHCVDEHTGAEILQWTSHPAMNHHFYFTSATISSDGGRGFFVSYRSGYPNLYSIDLESGVILRISDRVDINPFSPTVSADAEWIFVSARNAIFAFHTVTCEERLVCELPSARLGNCSISSDGTFLSVSCRGQNFCELALIETATGRVEICLRAEEIGHIQFCPADPDWLLYSGTVKQRLWMFQRSTGKNTWLYPQKESEWIVHESWLGNGAEIIFPHWPVALRAIRRDGTGLRNIAEINAWHACSNRQGTQVLCDTNHPDRGLLLIDVETGAIRTICHPGATQRGDQWRCSVPAAGPGIDVSILRSSEPENDVAPHPNDPASTYGPQWSHPHPTFSADGRFAVYTSDREGWSQIYQVTIPGNSGNKIPACNGPG